MMRAMFEVRTPFFLVAAHVLEGYMVLIYQTKQCQ